jgi:hypothetical protein
MGLSADQPATLTAINAWQRHDRIPRLKLVRYSNAEDRGLGFDGLEHLQQAGAAQEDTERVAQQQLFGGSGLTYQVRQDQAGGELGHQPDAGKGHRPA